MPLGTVDLQGNYINLAAAIINSGIKQNDVFFLESDWCSYLLDEVVNWNNRTHQPVCLLQSMYTNRRTGND